MTQLFATEELAHGPLAARMRPRCIEEFAGQAHLLGPGKPLSECAASGRLHSMVLWGPPGSGKTSLARLLAVGAQLHFVSISAVLAGVKDIRQAVDKAQEQRSSRNRGTVLFVDEAHRFNKAQQDAFLPFVEDGTLIFIGATTENPSFELNGALLSRARVYVLKALEQDALCEVLHRALKDEQRGLGKADLQLEDEQIERIARACSGDARRALNVLEVLAGLAAARDGKADDTLLDEALEGGPGRFDKKGDLFYEQISALHKSVRGSAPDAALFWLCRMLDGGCEPAYIARRAVRMASEDIGNADPRALRIALDAWEVQERLGSPEGDLALAQAILYLAVAPKSNAAYAAFGAAMADARAHPASEVPLHLRNAPTRLMKELGHGKGYRYAHKEKNAYAAGERYLPEEIGVPHYYQPVPRGLELRIGEHLEKLRRQDRAAADDPAQAPGKDGGEQPS